MRFCLKPWTTAGGGQTTQSTSVVCSAEVCSKEDNLMWHTDSVTNSKYPNYPPKICIIQNCDKSIQQYTSTKHLSFSPRDLVTSASSSSSLVGNGDDLLQAKRGESVKSWAISFKVLPICCAAWRLMLQKSRDHQLRDRQMFVPWFRQELSHDLQDLIQKFWKLQQVGLGFCQGLLVASQNNWQLSGMKSKCLLEEDLSVWWGCTHPCDDFLTF